MSLSLAAMLVFQACGGKEESTEGKTEKEFLTVTPTAAKNEPAYGHETVFSVEASGEVTAVIPDISWAVASVGMPDGGITPVTVSFDANDDNRSRSCTMTISSGSKKVAVPLTQSTLSSLIGSGSEVKVTGNIDAVVTFKLSKDWTLSLSTTRGAPDWLDANPKEGKGGERSDIAFHPDFFNLSTESRDAYARVTMADGSFFFFHITQESSLPMTDFLEKTAYGYYNYDGNGASIEFDALAHQSAVIRSSEGNSFRLIWPAKEKFFDFKGIPSSISEKDVIDLKLFHSWLTSSGKEEEHTVGVAKVTPDLVYAIDNDKRGYIIKNFQ